MSRRPAATAATAALKKLAKNAAGRSLNELRVVLALERAVARLEHHPTLTTHLVFKGGFVLLKTVETVRFTRDVDALAVDIARNQVPSMVEEALSADLKDGLWFGDLKVKDLPDQGSYGGYRFDCAFQLGDPPADVAKRLKLSRIHIDVGFGDAVDVPADKQFMTSILEDELPVAWLVYPLEFIFAEKLEALFSRGSANSRAKDVYDMALIFSRCERGVLRGAVDQVFKHRNTAIPDSFKQGASVFDLTILRSSWMSVVLTDSFQTFDEAWASLIGFLADLDATPRVR